MTYSQRWLGGGVSDGFIEICLPPSGLAVVVLRNHDGPDGKGPSKVCLFRPEDFKNFDSSLWLKSCGLQPTSISVIRLIGAADTLREKAPHFEGLGVALGKPVILEKPNAPIQFLPGEGRIRAQIGDTVKRRRVLVVDDSATIQKLLSSIISQDPLLECVGTVDRPSKVEEAIVRLKPDVITLDIHMPEMTGNELLKILLPKYPIPVVMISSLAKEDGHFVLDALETGAVDYIQKPSLQELDEVAPIIREKIRSAAESHLRLANPKQVPKTVVSHFRGEIDPNYLICLGSSTGGTEALREVLTALPEKIPPIVIVQHIPPIFSKAFAERLNGLCAFEVKEAEHGDVVRPSRVLIAPGGRHMQLKRVKDELIVALDDTAPVNRHKPSVDVLFDSVAALRLKKVAAGILTGMGADGAAGLLKLRQCGARTLAQDEATSVVYGMPREAALIGAAEKVVALSEVGSTLLQFCQRKAILGSAA